MLNIFLVCLNLSYNKNKMKKKLVGEIYLLSKISSEELKDSPTLRINYSFEYDHTTTHKTSDIFAYIWS